MLKREFNNCRIFNGMYVVTNMLQSNEDKSRVQTIRSYLIKSTDSVSEIIFQIVRIIYSHGKIYFFSFDLDITLRSSNIYL